MRCVFTNLVPFPSPLHLPSPSVVSFCPLFLLLLPPPAPATHPPSVPRITSLTANTYFHSLSSSRYSSQEFYQCFISNITRSGAPGNKSAGKYSQVPDLFHELVGNIWRVGQEETARPENEKGSGWNEDEAWLGGGPLSPAPSWRRVAGVAAGVARAELQVLHENQEYPGHRCVSNEGDVLIVMSCCCCSYCNFCCCCQSIVRL